ncbi:hypothetical protein GOV10_06980 [Candidatus Woesearchaeota archaeon]|nr:hypothetical protein [Candidatus Woesearchaeota archaeon]
MNFHDCHSEEAIPCVLKVMQSYGDNHWWESDDPITIARHQWCEKRILLVDLTELDEYMSILLGRPFYFPEFVSNDNLETEVNLALERHDKGLAITPEYLQEQEQDAVSGMMSYLGSLGKDCVVIDSEDGTIIEEEDLEEILNQERDEEEN